MYQLPFSLDAGSERAVVKTAVPLTGRLRLRIILEMASVVHRSDRHLVVSSLEKQVLLSNFFYFLFPPPPRGNLKLSSVPIRTLLNKSSTNEAGLDCFSICYLYHP